MGQWCFTSYCARWIGDVAGFGANRLRQGFCPQIYVSVRWHLDEAFNNLRAGNTVGGVQLAYLQAECKSLPTKCRPFGRGWATGVYSRSQEEVLASHGVPVAGASANAICLVANTELCGTDG